jgi:hypothetical protein
MGIVRRFTTSYRVRFDEAGANGALRASGVVRYLHDAAWQHTETVGMGRAWFREREVGWLARAIDLRLVGRAGYGETVTIETEVTGWRRVSSRRETVVRDGTGAVVARAAVDWALVRADGRPARIPDEVLALADDVGGFEPTKVALPDRAPDHALPIALRRIDADPMGHVNNAAYLDLLEETLARLEPPGSLTAPARLRLEYLRPALPSMALRGEAWRLPGAAFGWRLVDTGGGELARAIMDPA